jgi:hypothetical protein
MELLQIILTTLWHVCARAPMAAAVCKLFSTCTATVAGMLRSSSAVKPKRFPIHVDKLPAAFQLQAPVSSTENAQLMCALANWSDPKLLFYSRVLHRDGLLAVLDRPLPAHSQRTSGWLGDEEVNDLVAMCIPEARKGMGPSECLSLPSTLFEHIAAGHEHKAAQMGFKRAEPELFHAMMDTPLWVLPCCANGHWWDFFLQIPDQRILVADSLGQKHDHFARCVLNWLSAAHLLHTGLHTGCVLDTSSWEVWHVAVPLQQDGKACGIFAWLAAVHVSRGAPLDYNFKLIKFYRIVAALLLLRIRRMPLVVPLD